jgi:outer membrane protein
LAGKNNPQLMHSGISVQKARYDLSTARLSMLPTATATVKTHNSWGLFVDPTSNELVQEQNFGTSSEIEFNMILFSGFAQRNKIWLKREELGVANGATDKARIEVSLEIIGQYFQFLQASEIVEYYRQCLDSVNALERRIRSQTAKGFSTKRESLNLQYRKASLEAEITEQFNLISTSRQRINWLTGRSKDAELYLSKYGNVLALKNFGERISTSFTNVGNNPELRLMQSEINKKKATAGLVRANYFPKVELYGNLSTKTSTLKEDNFESQLNKNQNERLGIRLSYPISNAWFTGRDLRYAEYEVMEAESGYKLLKNQIQMELEALDYQYQQSYAQYLSRTKQLEAAKEEFRYSQQLFEGGNLSISDFNESFTKLNESMAECLIARYNSLAIENTLNFLLENILK